jgi:hypothetical protein
MKYLIALFIALILVMPVYAVDQKISELDAITVLTADDLLVAVDDPGGTPVTKKIVASDALKMQTSVYSADGTLNVTIAQATFGTFFVNTYAGTQVMTLPAAAAGMAVCLRNGQNNSRILQVHSDATDYLVLPATGLRNTAANHFAATASPMNQICLIAVDTTDWYITSTVGTWTAE